MLYNCSTTPQLNFFGVELCTVFTCLVLSVSPWRRLIEFKAFKHRPTGIIFMGIWSNWKVGFLIFYFQCHTKNH